MRVSPFGAPEFVDTFPLVTANGITGTLYLLSLFSVCGNNRDKRDKRYKRNVADRWALPRTQHRPPWFACRLEIAGLPGPPGVSRKPTWHETSSKAAIFCHSFHRPDDV